MSNIKMYFCEKKNAICITDSCAIGKELEYLPDFNVPVESRQPSPGIPELGIPADPEWGKGIWKINEPQFEKAECFLKFKDGTEKILYGKIKVLKGCEEKEE